jgi:hypothetical protein
VISIDASSNEAARSWNSTDLLVTERATADRT